MKASIGEKYFITKNLNTEVQSSVELDSGGDKTIKSQRGVKQYPVPKTASLCGPEQGFISMNFSYQNCKKKKKNQKPKALGALFEM